MTCKAPALDSGYIISLARHVCISERRCRCEEKKKEIRIRAKKKEIRIKNTKSCWAARSGSGAGWRHLQLAELCPELGQALCQPDLPEHHPAAAAAPPGQPAAGLPEPVEQRRHLRAWPFPM